MRHLKAINAEFVEGRAESAPEIDSAEKVEGDVEEELMNEEASGEVLSWVRKFIEKGEQKVKFCEKVAVRPIPAVGAGRSCRGSLRSSRRGRWPKSDGVSKCDGFVDQCGIEKPEVVKGINKIVKESDRGGDVHKAGIHEPRKVASHTCGIGRPVVWGDMSSDSEDESTPCRACREACALLAPTSRSPSRRRAGAVDSIELAPQRSCERDSSDIEEDFVCESFEPTMQHGAENVFVLSTSAVGVQEARNKPGLVVQLGAHLKSQKSRRLLWTASSESVSLRRHCAFLRNSRSCARVGEFCREYVDRRDDLIIRRRGSVRASLLSSTNGTLHERTNVQARTSALPCSHSCMRNAMMSEHRCAGSSPL